MSQLARHLATVVVIALGVPIALFGGVDLSCTATGMSPSCADQGLLLTPLILLVSGVVAAFLARGLLGFMLGAVGIVIGMALLWLVAYVEGTTIPIDPAQAVVATIWFGLPSVIGYSIGRGVMWAYARLMRPARPSAPGAAPLPGTPPDAHGNTMGEGI